MFFANVYSLTAGIMLTAVGVTSEQTKVTVYHESLCPACISFITQELYPTYEKLGDVFQVEMIPYGKATRTQDANGNWNFVCQHGENECQGNKYEVCALDQRKEQRIELQFLNCILSGTPYDKSTVKPCAVLGSYDWETLYKCATGNRGAELLVEYGKKTDSLNPKLTHVPTIVFNDIYDAQKDNDAYNNFFTTLCSELPQPKPNACQQ